MTNISFNQVHRIFLSFVVILLLLSKFLESFKSLSFVTYLDEFLILYLFIILIYSFVILKANKYILVIISILGYMIAISIYEHNSSIQNIIIQSLIHIKLFIFYFILYKYLKINDLKKIFYFLLLITLIGIVLNFSLQENFNNFTGQAIDYRNGFLRIGGLQVSSNLLGLTLGLFYLYFLFYRQHKIKNMLLIVIVFGSLIYFTGARTPLMIIIIGIFYYYLYQDMKYKIYLLPILIIISIIFTLVLFYSDIMDRTLNNFSSLEDATSSSYIRGIMIYSGFQLLMEHFPIGTGAATFGSTLSEGSKIYDVLSLTNRSFFIEMRGIYDSNIATIMGEFGFIGLILYGYVLKVIYKQMVDSSNRQYILSIMTTLVVVSFTNPVFMNAYIAILFALFLSLEKKKKEVKYENINNK